MAHKPKIAVVEDDADIAEIVRFALENNGCEVRLARDGADGLALAVGWNPDLVLMDVAMPRMDGLQALKGIRKDVRTRQTPVVMMTARSRGQDVQEAMSAGADDYLIKPFELNALLAKVRRRLGAEAGAATKRTGPRTARV